MSTAARTRPAPSPTPSPAGEPRRRKRRSNLASHLFLAVLVVYFLTPLWFLVVASTKNSAGLFSGGAPLWFGDSFHLLDNVRVLFTYDGGIYLRWLQNSLLYAVCGGVGATVLAVLAGYAFAKFDFPFRRVSFALLLGAVMVPLTALVIPTFMLLSLMELTNTAWAVILPSLLNPFGVYLMRVYAASAVPDELLDAARVDGAGEFRTFFTVALPLMRPAVVTVLLLSVVGTWNNYFLPLAVLTDSNKFPVTVGIGVWQLLAGSNNSGGETSLWVLIVIGSLLSIVPLIASFLLLQKYWQGGLTLGSLK